MAALVTIAIEERSRRVEEESPPPPLGSQGEELFSLSCHVVVIWERAPLLLLREEGLDPPCPIMMPSSAINDQNYPQSKEESPSPPYSPLSEKNKEENNPPPSLNVCVRRCALL